jgi:flagellar protein FlaG
MLSTRDLRLAADESQCEDVRPREIRDRDPSEGVVMDLTAIDRSITGIHAPTPVVTVDQAAENRQVVQAVKAINGAEMFGPENELRFQKDPETNRFVVRVIDRKTREVVSQVPDEYVLRLAEDMKKPG